MSPSLLIDPAAIELSFSRIAVSDLQNLAARLNLSYGQAEEYIDGAQDRDFENLRGLVHDAIQITFNLRECGELSDRLQQLAKIRVLFETVMAWHICRDEDVGYRVIQDLNVIHSEMEQVAADDFTIKLWTLFGNWMENSIVVYVVFPD